MWEPRYTLAMGATSLGPSPYLEKIDVTYLEDSFGNSSVMLFLLLFGSHPVLLRACRWGVGENRDHRVQGLRCGPPSCMQSSPLKDLPDANFVDLMVVLPLV